VRQLLGLKLSHVILAVRSAGKGRDAAKKLAVSYPDATIDVWDLDMASYESIQAFVQRIKSELPRLDVVILNAGLGKLKFGTASSTGHEEVIQVNYLSTALLTILLLPLLKQRSPSATPGRLTIINSALAFTTKFKTRDSTPLFPTFDDPKNFDPGDYYGTSKLLGQIFLWNLVDFVSAEDVTVNMVDPGAVGGTQLGRDLPIILTPLKWVWNATVARNVREGAAAYIDASVIRDVESHGCFIMGWDRAAFAPLLYTPEGSRLIEKVWRETMQELSFANPLGVLESVKRH
jgi:NAD(P)-dependent dehydrogenase (short-subunit alcohol dehydrogenase family)